MNSAVSNPSENLSALLDIATKIAKSAGELLMNRPETLAADTKSSDIDIVTQMDKLSEKLIVAAIQSARPDDGIVGEEGADYPSKSGYIWHIDPLDGTVNYFYDLPSWNVSIGIEDEQGPAVGVVYSPSINCIWTGARGLGSHKNGVRNRVNEPIELDRALIATGFPYILADRNFQISAVEKLLPKIRDLRRAGAAAVDICQVASGNHDGYYEQNLKSWDLVAAQVIATEAGAIVTYDPTRRLTIAAGPSLYAKLAALLA